MKRSCAAGILFFGFTFLAAPAGRAEVRADERSAVKFEGMMGRVMGMFGGKAMSEGVVNTTAVKGDRKMTTSESTGEIIDLAEEKIYLLDMKKKSFEVVTFEEMRRRMKEAREKATEAAQSAQEQPEREKPSGGKEMEIDISAKESGRTRAINGYDCREVVVTITAREKGKTLEEGGGMVMTSSQWLGPKIDAMDEIAAFQMRYSKVLGDPTAAVASAEQMAAAMAMYPAIQGMMGKFQAERVNMEGTSILTETTMEMVKTAEQVAQEAKQEKQDSTPTSIGGLGGFLGKKMMRKKEDKSSQSPNRATIMTMKNELLSVATSVAALDVAPPAGFKQKK